MMGIVYSEVFVLLWISRFLSFNFALTPRFKLRQFGCSARDVKIEWHGLLHIVIKSKTQRPSKSRSFAFADVRRTSFDGMLSVDGLFVRRREKASGDGATHRPSLMLKQKKCLSFSK